jgi:hypothetical protein
MAPAPLGNLENFFASFFQERRFFFSEEKKQKTFSYRGATLSCVLSVARRKLSVQPVADGETRQPGDRVIPVPRRHRRAQPVDDQRDADGDGENGG